MRWYVKPCTRSSVSSASLTVTRVSEAVTFLLANSSLIIKLILACVVMLFKNADIGTLETRMETFLSKGEKTSVSLYRSDSPDSFTVVSSVKAMVSSLGRVCRACWAETVPVNPKENTHASTTAKRLVIYPPVEYSYMSF